METLEKQIAKMIVYDNEGETFDRYTVFVGPDVYGLSHNPFSPQGYNEHVGDRRTIHPGPHLGKRLKEVPEIVEKAIRARYARALESVR